MRQTEGLLYAMTTKGQRRLASWQSRHVLQLGFGDEPQFNDDEDIKKGASVVPQHSFRNEEEKPSSNDADEAAENEATDEAGEE